MAVLRAFVTSADVCDASMDQPTTRRENESSATAQWTLASRVGCSVMSVTHNRSGAPRANSRLTRSLAAAVSCSGRRYLWVGRPFDTGSAHQHFDRVVPDDDAMTEAQLGVDPRCAVGATRSRVDRADSLGQPGVAQ